MRALGDLFMRFRSVWFTLALVGLFEAVHHLQGLHHVYPGYMGAAFCLLVVYAAFAQGRLLGLVSFAIATIYQFLELSPHGRFGGLSAADTEALLTITVTALCAVWLASGLRQKLERAVRLEADRVAAMAVAEELRVANLELHRLAEELRARNEHVESVVARRTQELATERDLMDRIIRHVPAAVVYLDLDDHIRLVNEAFASLIGVASEALIGKSFYDVVSQPKPSPRLETVRRTLEPLQATGLSFTARRDGREATVHLDNVYLPVFSEASVLEGILVFAVDVSARVEIERLQEEQIKNLQEVDRLKGDFINVASHELRTPLTSIRGYAEFLEDMVAGPLSPDQLAFVAQIQEGALRLQRIVDDMLDFARLEAGTFSLVWQEACLGQLIQEEVSSLAPQLQEARLSLQLALSPEPSWVRMDSRRIGQVLLNLLSNAIKFTPPDGSVTVRTWPADGMVRVEVEDTGIGVSPESQARLFEKFYQVDPSSTRTHGGAGLGLAISKAIVEGHGGSIGLESTPGRGSTFWFTLPLVPQPVSTNLSVHAE